MLNLHLPRKSRYSVLCLGAHSDDIEIGCGGTVLRLLKEYRNVEVTWIVFGSNPQRAMEASRSAQQFLRRARKRAVIVKDFRDGFFPQAGGAIKETFEDLKQRVSPDLIFTHYRYDLHQDHRQICDLTWNTFRNHLILEYEFPKFDGDLGTPNFFVPLDERICRTKVDLLLRHFATQRNKHWFDRETFYAIMRLRGVESGGTARYAEAFYSRKVIL